MVLFSYIARDAEGQSIQGTLDAVNSDAARITLEGMKMTIDDLHEVTPANSQPSEIQDIGTSSVSEPQVLDEEGPIRWTTLDEDKPQAVSNEAAPKSSPVLTTSEGRVYFPLVETLRLYAGWLLAGYFVAYALGSYQTLKPIPFQIPYVLAFLYSELILSFTLVAFLFLLFTELQKALPKGKLTTLILTIIAVGAFLLYRANT